MKIFTHVVFTVLALCAVFASQTAKAQKVMNPSDSVYTYNSTAPLGSVTNPNQPASGKIGKWIRTVRMSWNTSEWKCYIYNGSNFRIHFPHTYNPTANDGKKYPILLFYCGDGEEAGIDDNENVLAHGAQPFQTAIDNGTYDGYAVFMQCQFGWGPAQFVNYEALVDSLVANYKGDAYRVVQNGLSGGGQGIWNNLVAAPTYFAGSVPMSAALPNDATPTYVNILKYTPIWNLDGGLDNDPAPNIAQQVATDFLSQGANYVYKNYTTLGHDTWDSTWLEPNWWPFCNAANQANPWPLFNRTKFCPNQTISVPMGLVPGMAGYQWRLNGTVITGATSNTYTATQPGTYDARVMRNATAGWSNWSPKPVQVILQTTTVTPPIAVSGVMSTVLPDAAGDTSVTLTLPAGDSLYTWKFLSTGATVGTSQTLKVGASKTGDYVAAIIPFQGCSSFYSPAFPVVKATGPNPPSAASNLVTTALGFTKVQLTWATNPNPTYPATAYEIYRGTKTGVYKYVGAAAANALAYIDSLSVSAGVKYYYAIRAVDTTGAAPLSNESVVTTASDVTPPTAPGNLTVVSATNASITLSWTASTDNVGVDHYAVYTNGAISNVTTSLSFIVNGLTKGKLYSFYVKAVDASGNYSNQSSQVDAPALASGLNYSYYTTPVGWSVLPNFSTLTPTMSGNMPAVSIANATQATNFGYTWSGYINIPVAGTYKFQTSSDDGSALWFNTLSPTGTPTVNNDGSHGTTSVNSAALVLQPGVYPIFIEYFQGGGGSAMTASWSSTQLFGNSNFVPIASKYFAANYTPAGTAPAKPTQILTAATAYNKVNVSWVDNSNNETGFEVYRATSLGGPYQIVKTAPAGATFMIDSLSLTPSTKYYYKVQAINQYGGSGYDSASLGGLTYNFYQGAFSPLPNFDSIPVVPVVSSGTLSNISLAPAGSVTTNFGFLFSGVINIPVTGTYTFYTSSDDASELFINSYTYAHMVVNNNFQQGMTQRSGTITLAKGSYPFYVAYEQSGGGFGLTVSWANTAAGIPLSAIPDSVFYNKNSSTTTFALPAAPVTPFSIVDSAISASKVFLSWTDTSSAITGYNLSRSIGDSSHFNILATLAPGTTSFQDSSLFGHQTYYYKLAATGPGGTSAATAAIGVVTKDNPPVFTALPTEYVRYNSTKSFPVSVTDADGDTLALSAVNLPSFGTLTNTGNGKATLSFSPTSQGTYPGIVLSANDNHGAIVSDTFTLVVNNDYPPVFNTITNVTLNANTVLSVPISATDSNATDTLNFTVTGLPANSTLAAGPNGTDTIKLHPNYGDGGVYTVVATVNDNNGGITSDTFHITVVKVNPTQQVDVQFSAGDVAGAPWNVMQSSGTATGFKDINGNTTTIGLNFQPGWWTTFNSGPVTGHNSGVYPDKVEEDYFFFGTYPGVFTAPTTDSVQVTGLNPAQTYALTFYSASVWSAQIDNGTTTFSSQGQTGSLEVQNNTQNTVTFSGLVPNASGIITFSLGLGGSTRVGYLNSLVITSPFNDGTAPLSPSNLTVGLNTTGSGVRLNWYDSAYNETGYQILRSSSPTGPFTQLTPTTAAGVTSYVDSTSGSFRTYYYEVQAYNANGVSNPSNVASITTPDRVPSVNTIANVVMNNSQADTVQVITNADTTNPVTLTVTGLPAFASFTDNGNGTGTIYIEPNGGSIGNWPAVTVTSTDQLDSVRSTTFGIYIGDPQVTNTYIHFSDGTQLGAFPWNNATFWPSAGTGMGSLVNDRNVTTSTSFTFTNGMAGEFVGGMRPGNGAGIYPDPVMRSGEFEQAAKTDTIRLSGLQQQEKYNIVFFSSVDFGAAGTTNFTAQGKTVTVNPDYNIVNTVRINHLSPDVNGNIYIGVSKASGQTYAYLNDITIESYDSTISLLSPIGLIVKNMTTKAVNLQWQLRSYNETAVQVWRGTDSTGGTYQLIATLPPGTSTYKDSTITGNANYYYEVNVITASAQSNYSNYVYANPYSYIIYLSYSAGYNAPAPWNNIGVLPTQGYVSNNFLDANGNVTATGQIQTSTWGGLYAGGMQTGNNSGIVPDAVMIASYGLFPGQTGTVQLTGMDLNMSYDLTFFGSANNTGDNNGLYTANGKSALLNATENETGEVTIYGVQPDANGNIFVSCTAGTPTSQFGLMNAVILQAHSLAPSGSLPGAPGGTQGTVTGTTAISAQAMTLTNPDSTQDLKQLSAYPNPFIQQFTLMVPANTMNENVQVAIFDISGRLMYVKEFDNLTEGNNYLMISPGAAISQHGVYIVRVMYSDKTTVKFIRMLRL